MSAGPPAAARTLPPTSAAAEVAAAVPYDPDPHPAPTDPELADAELTEAELTETGPTDAELLQRHVDGDPDAFATLVGRHADRLWAVALRTMRNPEDAADALQDAYLSAFRRAASFRGEAQVTTWLHRVVVNACLDRLRALKVRAADPLPDDLDHDPDLGVTPDDPAVASQERADVVAALGRLNPDQRAALVLVDMQGYSVEEASQILGCAPGTVKSRCARGRVRLAPLLADLAPVSGRGRS